ncbi:sigma-70 family RNA polymerase sigma factor [uncultured Sphingomonas sp.]|uniref:RNA polymerase sigma factor n=1 Tax=uncultured Sphingomonas sp. TaxID=158754 RepID=UPI0030FC4F46
MPHERQLLAIATRICPTGEAARDLVQDVFLRMLTLTDWESIANPLGYMRRMIRNAAIDRLRHAKIVDFQSMSEIEHIDIPDYMPDQHRVAEDRDTLRRLVREVDGLPERCRVVFLKCRVHGASPRAVAIELGISLSTLEKRLARALILLSVAMTVDRSDPIDDSFDLWSHHRRTGTATH